MIRYVLEDQFHFWAGFGLGLAGMQLFFWARERWNRGSQ
jgi:hypothetical protein